MLVKLNPERPERMSKSKGRRIIVDFALIIHAKIS